MDFTSRYNSLNAAQKQAVDTIDGPVMVIAGPGTGKTELLSVRTANILKKTDTLPENILCLTFTESGAQAMRERLVGLLGKDAYKVAIHTFHSFGSEVINQFSEFFYEGAHFRAADELSRYEILRGIFEGLGHANVLNKKMNGEYTYLFESLSVISELKKSGLTSDELLLVLDTNDETIQKTEQLLSPIFADKPSKATAPKLAEHVEAIRKSEVTVALPNIVPLAIVLSDSLQTAIDAALESGKTTAITAWRNEWFKKNETGTFILKSHERQTKLRAISSIYEQYLARMSEAELYDFDDMILRVVHAMEIFDELRFNLQEKYQYIMVDEFQDTNLAQMRIVNNLTNNEAHGDTPNILVVGDDDQAIYSFQGADISNIINFRLRYPKVEIIALIDNYRSEEVILSQARALITQGSERLENHIEELNKELNARSTVGNGSVHLMQAQTTSDERHWLIDTIKTAAKKGTALSSIAVLTRKHQEIEKLLPYFALENIPVAYERRDNVLELEPIVFIEQLSTLLLAIQKGLHGDVNALLPQVLAHPVWNIPTEVLWSLSLRAYKNRTNWLDEMALTPSLLPLQSWMITTALTIPHTPLEQLLDTMIGNTHSPVGDTEHDDDDDTESAKRAYISPVYGYFFSKEKLASDPDTYIRYLDGLRAIRTKLREYKPLETPTLFSFIEFVTLHKSIGSGITSIRSVAGSDDAVQLMTAHKSKGLEFDTVFIVNAIDSVWGDRARSHSRLISYPENLPLSPVGDSADERLRLFYVGVTRAKRELFISFSRSNDANKANARVSFLVGSDIDQSWEEISPSADSYESALQTAEVRWYESITRTPDKNLSELLMPQLENYQLSVTHLTNFLDVSRGGPQNFLLQNLLRFPQAMSPASAYGSAIHATLQRAHAYVTTHKKHQAIEDILKHFESALTEQHLAKADFDTYLTKGSDDLRAFLGAKYDSFTPSQKVEINFKSQQVIIDTAHLSGALDLFEASSDKSVTVTDYKTGKPIRSWVGKTDYEKIKLHKYEQQLMFYKLLVEHARDYRGHIVETGVLQFIEPTSSKEIISIERSFNQEEMVRFQSLIGAVWKRIQTLDLPDISSYDQSLKGILAFEQDLIDGTV